MASWHDARRAWERSQPQLFFEVDDLTKSAGERPNPSGGARGINGSGAPAPGSSFHDNGRVGSPVRASADAATGGSF